VAAEIRDQIKALEVSLEKQRVVSSDFLDQDVVGYHREGIALEIVVMSIRNGQLNGNRAYSFTGQEFPDAELISSFVGLYYDLGAPPPDEVLLPVEIEDAPLKAEWLTEKRAALPGGEHVERSATVPREAHRGGGGTLPGARSRKRVEVLVPQRGDRKRLIDLAQKNAAASFATRRNARADVELALGKLQRRLKLTKLPRVIECYDVSHLQGFATVASMVVFVDGRPEKSRYRTYKVRAPGAAGRSRHNDDFASMYEVLSRRFRRALHVSEGSREGAGGVPGRAQRGRVRETSEGSREDDTWKLPDLIVVDGGKGQLAMALAAARDVGIDVRAGVGLPIVALAKERDVALAEGLAEGDVAVASDATSEATTEAEAADAQPAAAAGVQPAAAAGAQPAAAADVAPPAVESTVPAKKPGRDVAGTTKPDRVFLPHAKDAIPIRNNSGEMFVLQQLRDEAHRFAISFHRNSRRRLTLRSALSEIPGIGPGRQRQLLRHFGSVKRVREATVAELAAAPGISPSLAEVVHAYWAKQPLEPPAADAHATSEELAIDDAFSSGGGAVVEMTTEGKQPGG
jgi:excinuclease ABC subunit C